MRAKIEVTQEHINKGIPCDGAWCAISLAIGAVTKEAPFICIDLLGNPTVTLGDKRIYLPKECGEFIRNFDNGETVKPFSFEMEVR